MKFGLFHNMGYYGTDPVSAFAARLIAPTPWS